MIQCDLKQCAYLGDAVWELFVREICITKAKTQKAMHNFSTRYVNASFQAHLLECVVESFNDEEKELLRQEFKNFDKQKKQPPDSLSCNGF